MCKQVMIGLFAISMVAMWWTEADAATCLQWKYLRGSKICTKWNTKGVMLTVVFIGQNCGDKGEACSVQAAADAKPDESVAFCQKGGEIRRVKCPVSLSFFGGANGCAPGIGDDPAEGPVCTVQFLLNTNCQACCDKDPGGGDLHRCYTLYHGHVCDCMYRERLKCLPRSDNPSVLGGVGQLHGKGALHNRPEKDRT